MLDSLAASPPPIPSISTILHALTHHPAYTFLILSALYLIYRIIANLFISSRLTYASQIPTYLPFGLDFILWSIYHNRSSLDIVLWQKIFTRYGRGHTPYTAGVQLGSEKVLFTADAENIKAVLAVQFNDFGKGRKFYNDWREFLGNSIFATDGKLWSEARALIRPLFLRERIESLAVFEKHTVKLTRMLGRPDGGKGRGREVDIMNFFFRFTLDVATDFLFGVGIGSLDNPREKFAIAFAEVQRVQTMISVAGPLLPFISKRSYRAAIHTVNAFMEPFITRTLALPLSDLEKLTKSNKDYTFLSALALFTRDPTMIRDQLVAVLLAGRDTTAATLSWCIHELSSHPEIVQRLRAEIKELVKPGQTPSFADLKNMKYLQAILNETLRLYPAIPFNMRVALQDTTLPRGGGKDGLDEIVVEKDTVIAYTPLLMQRRRELYPTTYPDGMPFPDPAKFAPERWLHTHNGQGGSNKGNTGPWMPASWTYIPFNGGPRICLGQQFALTEMGYTLVRIFQQYSRVERVDSKRRLVGEEWATWGNNAKSKGRLVGENWATWGRHGKEKREPVGENWATWGKEHRKQSLERKEEERQLRSNVVLTPVHGVKVVFYEDDDKEGDAKEITNGAEGDVEEGDGKIKEKGGSEKGSDEEVVVV